MQFLETLCDFLVSLLSMSIAAPTSYDSEILKPEGSEPGGLPTGLLVEQALGHGHGSVGYAGDGS